MTRVQEEGAWEGSSEHTGTQPREEGNFRAAEQPSVRVAELWLGLLGMASSWGGHAVGWTLPCQKVASGG